MCEHDSQPALKYEAEVQDGGRVEVTVPFSQGTRVVVFVVGEPDGTLDNLVAASQSTLAFWDNPLDDEDWNTANPRSPVPSAAVAATEQNQCKMKNAK
ncbi:MAG: hypothetical protein ACLQLG_05505 [Thermoguttaceae bacterium]